MRKRRPRRSSVLLEVPESHPALIGKAAELLLNRWHDRTRVRLCRRETGQATAAWRISLGTIAQPEFRARIEAAQLPLPVQPHSYAIATGGRHLFVCGADAHGVLYGAGHLLRQLKFAPDWVAMPALRVTRTPAVYNRGVLLTNHFNNFYEAAPLEEVECYIEEMALWGFDLLSHSLDTNWFPHGFWNDPQSRGTRMVKLIQRMSATARACGMKILASGGANEGFFRQPPPELRADPRARHGGFYPQSQICPSKPGGLEMILEVRRKVTELMGPIDMFSIWPYDQGGCGCDQCAHAPGRWGRKYLEIGPAIAAAVRERYPNVQIIVATWLMDETERKMIYELCDQRADWFHGVMTHVEQAGEHPIDPRYLRLTFPEISMFDCYFTSYGCNGANPAPQRFATEARHVARHGCGATLYSEGCYDDVNKAVYAGLLWDPQRDVAEVLAEYGRYYFGTPQTNTAVALMRGLETTWGKTALLNAAEKTVVSLARKADDLGAGLPRHRDARLRWRMLRDRARMDLLMKQVQPLSAALTRESLSLFNDTDYISLTELRQRLQAFLRGLRQRQKLIERLFAVHWDYMCFFHFEKNIMIFLPDEVAGKLNLETLVAPLTRAVCYRNAAQLRREVMRAFKRWHWFNSVDADYIFPTP